MQTSTGLQGDKIIFLVAIATTLAAAALLTTKKKSKKNSSKPKEVHAKTIEIAALPQQEFITPTKALHVFAAPEKEESMPSEAETSDSEGSDSEASERDPAEATEQPTVGEKPIMPSSPPKRKSFVKNKLQNAKSQILRGLKKRTSIRRISFRTSNTSSS